MKEIKCGNSIHFQYSLDPYLTSWWMGIRGSTESIQLQNALNTISSWDFNHSKWEIPVFQGVYLKRTLKENTHTVLLTTRTLLQFMIQGRKGKVTYSKSKEQSTPLKPEIWERPQKMETNGRSRKEKDHLGILEPQNNWPIIWTLGLLSMFEREGPNAHGYGWKYLKIIDWRMWHNSKNGKKW